MAADRPLTDATRRRAYEDDLADKRLAEIKAKIQRNKPNGRAALHWRRDSATRLVSNCGRFAIDKTGEGQSTRYTAKLLPHGVLAERRLTVEEAKEDCNRQASPLALEAPVTEREPGSDDE